MSTGSLSPVGQQQFFDDSGAVLNGGFLYYYVSGTSTPTPVYSDVSLTVPYATPVPLDSAGRPNGGLYLDPTIGSYKLIVKDANGVQVGNTIDPVPVTNAGTSGLGEVFVFGSNSASPITATSYASGTSYATLQPGSGVWDVDSATLSGTYVLECMGLQNTAGTLTAALVNLDGGAPDTPLATCAITSATGELVQSAAITFAAAGTAYHYGIKTKVSANTGFLISARIVRTA